MAQIQNELAERELIKEFRHSNTWIGSVTSKNNWVGNDVIKIPRRGIAPNVLINNNIYPIVRNDREDDFIVLSLNKYDTENTTISDDELYALPYEKINDVQVQHREQLEDKTQAHFLYSIAPAANAAKTPVLATTGADDGTGRKRLTTTDLITFRTKLLSKPLLVPKKGIMLILCAQHIEDLLLADLTFQNSYQNIKDGLISKNYCGFETYEDTNEVTYKDVGGTLTKEAFDGVPTGKTASIVAHRSNLVKAVGSVKRYSTLAENDPDNRETKLGFRLWAGCFATKDEGMGAIVSGTVS